MLAVVYTSVGVEAVQGLVCRTKVAASAADRKEKRWLMEGVFIVRMVCCGIFRGGNTDEERGLWV